jgi:hypothetical protein
MGLGSRAAMFSVMELRLIRHAVSRTMDNLQARLKILSQESDDAVEITNDLMLYQIILDKINERKDV